VAKRRIKETVEGFAELTAMLAEAATAPGDDPGGDRDPRGLLVPLTRHRPAGLPDQPDGRSPLPGTAFVSRKKSDHLRRRDVGNILRTDAHAHRPLPEDTELARAVRGTVPAPTRNATWRRTRAGQRSSLPAARVPPRVLGRLRRGNATNLASPDARAVLAIVGLPPWHS